MSRYARCLAGATLLPALLALAGAAPATERRAESTPKSRTFGLSYKVTVDAVPEGTDTLRVWIPVPQTTAGQTVSPIRVMGIAVYEIKEEQEYGNRYLYTELLKPKPGGGFSFGYLCQVTRNEVVGPQLEPEISGDTLLTRLLGPDRLVPVEGRPEELAREATAGAEGTAKRARSLYDWVLAEMTYDKSGTGWGRGDFAHACEAKTGNCTDFHSYFIALARASGIPALFEIGLSLPPDQSEGIISGYHCWAKYYDTGAGWMPVDISEADRHPELATYYFGNLSPDRVMLSRGRDLHLVPAPSGGSLNYFVDPVLEADGEKVETFTRETKFRDL